MRGTVKKLIVIFIMLLMFTACEGGVDPTTHQLRVDVAQLEERVNVQQEVIERATHLFVELSNDYTLLERRVEALEAP